MIRGYFQTKTRAAPALRKFPPFLPGLLFCALLVFSSPVLADHCVTCSAGDCSATEQTIVSDHVKGRAAIKQHMAQAFQKHQTWWDDILWKQILLPAMMQMTTQLSAVGMFQMMGIGMQFDAKEQLEAQQLFQKLQAKAHKEYTPSAEFCAVGTNTRSLAASTEKSRHNILALNEMALERHLGVKAAISASQSADKHHRWEHFVKKYCNAKDNGYQVASSRNSGMPETGLEIICDFIPPAAKQRLNIDVDYSRQIEEPLTIDADFTDAELPTSGQEEDLIALARNLYGHSVLSRNTPALQDLAGATKYLGLRAVAAKRAVAENSFYNIAGMKLSGSDPQDPGTRKKTKETMAAVLKQLGMPENEISRVIGTKPSSYAQLEILAKKIFQSTDFFTSLYDKPANVERRKVAMAAIGLMVDRAVYESRLRQEMLASVLVSARLRPEVERLQSNLTKTKKE